MKSKTYNLIFIIGFLILFVGIIVTIILLRIPIEKEENEQNEQNKHNELNDIGPKKEDWEQYDYYVFSIF